MFLTNQYDTNGRVSLQTPANSATYEFDYTLDGAGRCDGSARASSARRSIPAIEVPYDYDAASQLTGLTYTLGSTTLGTLTYTYDLVGNRTEVGGTWTPTNLPATLSSATYDAANQIATWDSTSFTYDLNGSLTADGTRSYTLECAPPTHCIEWWRE